MRATPLLIPPLISLLFVAACGAPPEGDEVSEPQASSTGVEMAEPGHSDVVLAESGWLVVGEDGAVYTTMLDPGGAYRDFRNGEPLQSGTWEKREGGELCFIPAAEDSAGECWTLGKLQDGGIVRASASSGREVSLRRVAYSAPDETPPEAGN